MTTESPCATPEGLTVRSGAIAPFRIHRLASFTTPDCASAGTSGLLMSTSYQRNSDRGPLATTWPVHTTILPMRGSFAATAWVSRPSSVSSRLLVPFWGAFVAGGEYTGTVIDWPVTCTCGTLGLPGVGRTAWTVIRFPGPQMPGHSMSEDVSPAPD